MKYHLIDMADIGQDQINIVNKAYSLWSDVYGEELKNRNLELSCEDFWNCRILAVIESQSEIIGSHIYNVFDLRTPVTAHKYFNDITSERIEKLRQRNVEQLMTFEYLLVNPKYRGKSSSIRWGEVVIGLGMKVLAHSPWQGAVGIARSDKKVDSMSQKMGGQESEKLVKNQTPCKVMTVEKNQITDHQDPETQSLIDQLWQSKAGSVPWLQRKPLTLAQAS